MNEIDQYIANYSSDIQERLTVIRELLREELPNATEKISYQLPTFWQKKNVIHYGAFQHHIGLYPTSSGIEAFKERLTNYKFTKGEIQLPHTEPLPLELIREIARYRLAEVSGGNA